MKDCYDKIKTYLNHCLVNDNLSHSYIFYGPDETYKRKIAFWFANNILKNQDAKFHPDLFSFKPEFLSDIPIDLIRQMKKFMNLSPYGGIYKVAIIENAENLNDYAQNALLKIFEEAPAHAIMILCVKTLDSIRETVASRAVKLPFWRLDEQKEERFFDIFERVFERDGLELFSALEDLSRGNKTPEVFECWLKFLRTKFILSPEKKLFDLLKISQNIYFKLNETNINPKLAYDELLLNSQFTTSR